jgi:hypothetical protein
LVLAMDKEKFESKFKKYKEKVKRQRAMNKEKKKKNINFDSLDKYGKEMWSYQPTPKTRKNLLKILDRSSKNKQRKALIEKIGEEFIKIYEEYMNLIRLSLGGAPFYKITDKSIIKKFQNAAIECLRQEINLKQLLKYWDKNTCNLANNPKFPSVYIITSPGNIMSAASYVLSEEFSDEKQRYMTAKEKHLDWVASRNSFADLRKLNPEIRKKLKKDKKMNAGKYSDEELMTAQVLAEDLMEGVNIYISEEIRPVVYWIVKNIYGKKS